MIRDDKAIVGAIINMASSLGIKTIAEGVETSGQLAFLRLQGCDEVQGITSANRFRRNSSRHL